MLNYNTHQPCMLYDLVTFSYYFHYALLAPLCSFLGVFLCLTVKLL